LLLRLVRFYCIPGYSSVFLNCIGNRYSDSDESELSPSELLVRFGFLFSDFKADTLEIPLDSFVQLAVVCAAHQSSSSSSSAASAQHSITTTSIEDYAEDCAFTSIILDAKWIENISFERDKLPLHLDDLLINTFPPILHRTAMSSKQKQAETAALLFLALWARSCELPPHKKDKKKDPRKLMAQSIVEAEREALISLLTRVRQLFDRDSVFRRVVERQEAAERHRGELFQEGEESDESSEAGAKRKQGGSEARETTTKKPKGK